ncbi:hypothetical protein FACS189452_00940 [Bacteroidia bacterium]|nr:hypothetical protein FACS189452_00940 [Bacteroidia bacterium]
MSRICNIDRSPFAQYSAEEELDFIDEIYYEPRYYSELLDLLSSGVSRFILGQRGQGKSATIYKLFNDLSKNHTLPLLITRYDGIPLSKNENYLLYKIMQAMTIGIAKHLFENQESKKNLSKDQQKRLSFFIELFYEADCANQFIEAAKSIKRKKKWNAWYKFFNGNVLKLLNTIINGTVSITATFIRNSIGLGDENFETTFCEYIKELKIKDFKCMNMQEVATLERDKLLNMLNFLIETSISLGYKSIVILFDKIDEFQEINSDVEKVTDFAVEILSDTDLLYSDRLSIVFSLWSEVKRTLNKRGVRFDKFKEIDIRWNPEELEELINYRLKFFSIDKSQVVTLNSLIINSNDKKTVLELADRSPRSLIRVLGEIYNEDHKGENLSAFTSTAISKGLVRFCAQFDYESQQPSKTGKRSDLINWINRSLRIRKTMFTIEDLNRVYSQRTTVSTKHIDDMMKLGIIKESYDRTHNNLAIYEIVDPKLKYLISRGVIELDQ